MGKRPINRPPARPAAPQISAMPVPPPKEELGRGPGNVVVQDIATDHQPLTGRKLVRVIPGHQTDVERLLRTGVALRVHPGDPGAVAAASNPEGAGALPVGEALFFETLGILTINPDPEQSTRLAALVLDDNPLDGEEWERYVFVGADPAYLRGYRAGVDTLIEHLLTDGDAGSLVPMVPGSNAAGLGPFLDNNRTTWGLKATRADATRFTGKDIAVAVLDTGIDLKHLDFSGRVVAQASFVPGAPTVQDGHGHGTHCAGVVAGPASPVTRPRYGVATDARLYVGKVLGDNGIGTDTSILGGITWALDQKCAVISMSLGAKVLANQPRSATFEQVGRRALDAGCVIFAAAGNDSERPGKIIRVSHPANCRTFFAVAALDANLRVAPFSNAGLEIDGGQVDIAAPGVQVLSAVPGGYARMDGTSMATPHVAGIAALVAEADPKLRGHSLMSRLSQIALRISERSVDVGVGLAQSP